MCQTTSHTEPGLAGCWAGCRSWAGVLLAHSFGPVHIGPVHSRRCDTPPVSTAAQPATPKESVTPPASPPPGTPCQTHPVIGGLADAVIFDNHRPDHQYAEYPPAPQDAVSVRAIDNQQTDQAPMPPVQPHKACPVPTRPLPDTRQQAHWPAGWHGPIGPDSQKLQQGHSKTGQCPIMPGTATACEPAPPARLPTPIKRSTPVGRREERDCPSSVATSREADETVSADGEQTHQKYHHPYDFFTKSMRHNC